MNHCFIKIQFFDNLLNILLLLFYSILLFSLIIIIQHEMKSQLMQYLFLKCFQMAWEICSIEKGCER